MSLDRIIGYDSIKTQLEALLDVLNHREAYTRLGTKTPRGLLLYGQPGVGKTLMANAFAEASGNRRRFCIRKEQTTNEFIKTLHDTFEKAKEQASIILLDDMDKYSEFDRLGQNTDAYVAIQTCIDDLGDSDVFVVATANSLPFPSSLLRPGRFDRIIEVPVPSGKDAERIIAHYLHDKPFASDINIEMIARIMDELTCADLESVINEAGMLAGFSRSDKITMRCFIEAAMHIVFNIPSLVIPKDGPDFPKIAIHEAGHACVLEALIPGSVTLVSACGAENGKAGFTAFYKDKAVDNLRWQESQIISALGGMAAIELVYGKKVTGASFDLSEAFERTNQLVSSEGLFGLQYHECNAFDCSPTMRARQEQATYAEVEKYYQKAKEILAKNKSFHEAITSELYKKPYLTMLDLKRIKNRCRVAA